MEDYLVILKAKDCSWCKQFAPLFSNVLKEVYSRNTAFIGKIHTLEVPYMRGPYNVDSTKFPHDIIKGVTGFPSFIFYKKSEWDKGLKGDRNIKTSKTIIDHKVLFADTNISNFTTRLINEYNRLSKESINQSSSQGSSQGSNQGSSQGFSHATPPVKDTTKDSTKVTVPESFDQCVIPYNYVSFRSK